MPTILLDPETADLDMPMRHASISPVLVPTRPMGSRFASSLASAEVAFGQAHQKKRKAES